MIKKGFKKTEIGMIPEEWEAKSISQIGEVITGKTPKTIEKDNFGIDYPFITPRDMKEQKHVFGTERYLSEKGKNSVKNCLIPKDSICISCIGSDMGKVIMTTEESITNQQINSIIPIVSSDFVYYAMLNISPNIKNLGKQSTAVPILNKSQFSKIEIAMPSETIEIKEIAKILSDLDSKIELNHRMNKTLETIGQAIFKEWFVDFEFPNEEGKPYKSSGGEMVDSGLGKIPRGWTVRVLGDCVNIVKGCSYRSADLKESKSALVTLKSISRGGGFNQNGYKEYIGTYDEEQVLSDGDIIVAQTDLTQKAEVIGRPAIVTSMGYYEELIASLDLQIIRPNAHFFRNFVYYLLETDDFHNHALSYTNGTTVLHLNRNAVPKYLFALPPDEILEMFNRLVSDLMMQIWENEKEVILLSQTRDSLLPKLMSGKIRIPEAEVKA